MTGQNRLDNARAEALLGDDALGAADALLGLGLANDAVSRAYYAAFHYARALLLLEGLEPKTHRGVIALLGQHFEAAGRLAPGRVSDLAALLTFRAIADYDARDRVSRAHAEAQVVKARAFVESARELLTEAFRAGSQ
ncbi:MAG: HEPN domain-containing protein [Polyangiaceae bacterium]|nr:HEPN domain-containing protein [Polyangiaceae bacterium]